ncbi:MAG: ferritin-like domain-containing protein [Myxococcales bacterium FL481]|nr:MAG: ferritin-like domain-containing protein [Myxococcales bacterium FL481]
MRDTDRLLARLRALATCLPVSAPMLACDREPAPPPKPASSTEPEAAATPATRQPTSKPTKPARPVIPRKPRPRALAGYEIGDPPFVEGYNPEEETCPTGDWCGTREVVEPFTLPRDTEEAGCPTRIVASERTTKKLGSKRSLYRGLSLDPAMQGVFKPWYTARAREREGVEDLCCYHWFEYCSGRALVADGGALVSTLVDADALDGWASFELPPPEPWEDHLDERTRRALAQAWARDALHEHASIASFARATMELIAVGAPADLVAATQRAGLDEVVHTRACLALARRYGGAAQRPAALPPLSPRASELTRLASDTFLEACLGETIAALRAQRQLNACESAAACRVLALIAEDEAEHAAVGWATLRWAMAQDRGAVRAGLQRLVIELRGRMSRPAAVADGLDLMAAGRLTPALDAAVIGDAWRDIVEPMALELVG